MVYLREKKMRNTNLKEKSVKKHSRKIKHLNVFFIFLIFYLLVHLLGNCAFWKSFSALSTDGGECFDSLNRGF